MEDVFLITCFSIPGKWPYPEKLNARIPSPNQLSPGLSLPPGPVTHRRRCVSTHEQIDSRVVDKISIPALPFLPTRGWNCSIPSPDTMGVLPTVFAIYVGIRTQNAMPPNTRGASLEHVHHEILFLCGFLFPTCPFPGDEARRFPTLNEKKGVLPDV